MSRPGHDLHDKSHDNAYYGKDQDKASAMERIEIRQVLTSAGESSRNSSPLAE